jgi:putative endonuclease
MTTARQYYVYMMTGKSNKVIYTGVTNDLRKRAWEHREGQGSRFTTTYKCTKLVYYEIFHDSYNAIAREKQIKAGSRAKKVVLIERMNPEWRDLYEDL